MLGAIGKLFGVCLCLVAGAVACLYAGQRASAGAPQQTEANELARQFVGDPGDGWTLLGGFLLIVAAALFSAGVMLWHRERSARG